MHNRFQRIASISIVALAGAACSPDASVPTTAAEADAVQFDPVAGDYPQIFWHCTLWEVPARSHFVEDGMIRPEGGPKSRGMVILSAEGSRAAFDSVRDLPSSRHLASPAVFSKPGQSARIQQQQEDKARSSVGDRSISLIGGLDGGLDGEMVVTTLEVVNAEGGEVVSCGAEKQPVPEGGAIFFLCPGPEPQRPWTLVAVRPTILRSVADYPFQRASSMSVPER